MARSVLLLGRVQVDNVKLSHDDATPSVMFVGIIAVLWFSFVACVGIVRNVCRIGGHSKADATQDAAQTLAFEAYPQYTNVHGTSRCPTARDFLPYVDYPEIAKDTWGSDFVVTCTSKRVVVTSVGEDGRIDTADDIVVETAR